LEEVNGLGIGCLSLYARVSQKRDLRLDVSTAARGGLRAEVQTQILIARDLGYLEPNESENLLAAAGEVGRILNGLLASLPSRDKRY
jgi:four helix bundle protein